MKHFYKITSLVVLMLFITSWAHSSRLTPQKKHEVSLMISATTVMQKIKQKKQIFLVDIRHQTQFAKFKIPGSMNIPLSFIKTKSFLKTKPVVLIHKGFGYTEITKEALNLNQNGFDIKILQGGFPTWKHKGGTLVGDPFSQKDLNKMPVNIFFQEKDYENWIIINACLKPPEKNKALIPKAFFISGKKNNMKTGEIVNSIFTDQSPLKQKLSIPPNNPMMSVIIFDETGNRYKQLKKEINPAFKHKVFYLEGGIQAYQRYLKYQMLANKPKSQRTKEIGHCEPCTKQGN